MTCLDRVQPCHLTSVNTEKALRRLALSMQRPQRTPWDTLTLTQDYQQSLSYTLTTLVTMARKDASGWVPDAPVCSGQLRKHIIGVFCKVLKQHYLELSVRLDPGWGPS